MDFKLTTEHEMVQKMVRDFAQKEVAPTIKEQDRIQEMAPSKKFIGSKTEPLSVP